MTTSHTPGPWCVGKRYTTDVYAENMQGIRIAACFDGGDANAARIVRCVNAHDDLLAALQKLVDFNSGDRYQKGSPVDKAYKAARAAILKATS